MEELQVHRIFSCKTNSEEIWGIIFAVSVGNLSHITLIVINGLVPLTPVWHGFVTLNQMDNSFPISHPMKK
jgi:hypothetical protein